MATSGYRDEWVTNWDTLRFSWSRSSYSIADNTSDINWSLVLISGSYGAISSSSSKSWSVTVNGTNYSGTTTVGIGNNTSKTLASGSTTISHNADGTKDFAYSFSQTFGITFSGSYIGTVSGSSSGTLDSIPRKAEITYAPDFTDEDTPTVNFNNPAGSSVTLKACISWTGGDDIAYRNLSWYEAVNGYYTFNFTDEERTKLRNATLSGSNSRYVTMYITTFSASGSLIDYSTKQVKFTVINCNPALDPTVVDQGSVSTTLTGDPNKIIKYYNNCNVTFNANALKGASITSMKVTCGSKSRTSNGVLDYVDDGTFVFSVTDNRGITVSKSISKTTIDYIPLTCNFSSTSDLVEGSTANINILVSGNYFNGSFGAVTNSLTLEYRYKTNDGEYGSWTPLTYTITDGKYTARSVIEGLDYNNSYTFQARAKDAIYTSGVNTIEQVVRIVPVFDWGENDFNFNVPVTIEGSVVQTARCFSAYCANVSVHHSSTYGMTVVPIDTSGIQCGKSVFRLIDNQIEIVDDDIHLIRIYANTDISDVPYYMIIAVNGAYPSRPNSQFFAASVANNIGGYASTNVQIMAVEKGDKIGLFVGYPSPFSATILEACITVEVVC